MRLSDWQLAFEHYVLGQPATANPALQQSLVGGPTLDVATGLAIYHNAYQARLQEVLRNDFAAVWNWLGDEEFACMAAAYLREHPSAHYSLRWLGQGFASFIRTHLVEAQSAPLAELADLEWALTLAFDAPEQQALTLEVMASLPPAAWPALQVGLQPCVQWLTLCFNSVALWRSAKEQSPFPGSQRLPVPQVLVIWRAEQVCHYRSLSADEAWALDGMVNGGWTFADLCTHLTQRCGEGAPLQAVTWLKQWVIDGLLEQRNP